MQISVLFHIERINLNADDTEVLARQFDRLPDILDRRHRTALAGQQQNLLQTGRGDGFQLPLDFLHIEPRAADLIMAVKSAIYAIVFTIVGDVQRGKHLHRVTEVLTRLHLGALRHLLKKRRGGRRQERGKILRLQHVAMQCALHIGCGILLRVVGLHPGDNLVLNVRADVFHAGLVGHVVGFGGDIFGGDNLRLCFVHLNRQPFC